MLTIIGMIAAVLSTLLLIGLFFKHRNIENTIERHISKKSESDSSLMIEEVTVDFSKADVSAITSKKSKPSKASSAVSSESVAVATPDKPHDDVADVGIAVVAADVVLNDKNVKEEPLTNEDSNNDVSTVSSAPKYDNAALSKYDHRVDRYELNLSLIHI